MLFLSKPLKSGSICLGTGLMILLAMSIPSYGQEREPVGNIITTHGHAQTQTLPDSFGLSITVETQANKLEQARNENAQKMQSVMQAIQKLSIPTLKIKTQQVNISPVQDWQNGHLPKVIGYRAVNSIYVSVTHPTTGSLSEYSTQILDTSLNAGANQVGGIEFSLSSLKEVQDQVLQDAIKDAAHTAQLMAQAAGVEITGLYTLEGSANSNSGYNPPRVYMMRAKADTEQQSSTPVEAGEVTVTSDVSAVFKFR